MLLAASEIVPNSLLLSIIMFLCDHLGVSWTYLLLASRIWQRKRDAIHFWEETVKLLLKYFEILYGCKIQWNACSINWCYYSNFYGEICSRVLNFILTCISGVQQSAGLTSVWWLDVWISEYGSKTSPHNRLQERNPPLSDMWTVLCRIDLVQSQDSIWVF